MRLNSFDRITARPFIEGYLKTRIGVKKAVFTVEIQKQIKTKGIRVHATKVGMIILLILKEGTIKGLVRKQARYTLYYVTKDPKELRDAALDCRAIANDCMIIASNMDNHADEFARKIR